MIPSHYTFSDIIDLSLSNYSSLPLSLPQGNSASAAWGCVLFPMTHSWSMLFKKRDLVREVSVTLTFREKSFRISISSLLEGL